MNNFLISFPCNEFLFFKVCSKIFFCAMLFQSSVLLFLTVTNHSDFFQFFPNYSSKLLFHVIVFVIYKSFQSKKYNLKLSGKMTFFWRKYFVLQKKLFSLFIKSLISTGDVKQNCIGRFIRFLQKFAASQITIGFN